MKEMKHDSSTRSWSGLGDEWLELARQESRLHFIMPCMLGLMGEVTGKRILDLGCGEGGYARELTRRGAQVTAVDCSEKAVGARPATGGGGETCHYPSGAQQQ